MKALVTGGSGFVGRHLIAHLEAAGDEVVAVDRSDGSLDITDADSVTRCLAQHRPEVVYHLAGDSDVGGSWNHPAATFVANANGTLNVLVAARQAGVERVVNIASADIYGHVGPDELPITEASEFRPVSPYAASKVAADQLGLQAWLGHSQAVLRLRPFNHLGPGQSTHFVAPALASRIARNEMEGTDVVPVGNLSAARDFTDVRDVSRAYRLLALHGQGGEAYNVCRGVAVVIEDLAKMLLDRAESPMHLEVDSGLFRPIDLPVLLGDPSKLRQATGWEPEIPLEQTMDDLLADQRRRVRTPT